MTMGIPRFSAGFSAIAAAVLLTAGCADTAPDAPARQALPKVTEEQAADVFSGAVQAAASGDPVRQAGEKSGDADVRFCANTQQPGACAKALRKAKDKCLKPGEDGHVVASKLLPARADRTPARVLVVEGITTAGRTYRSDFVVVSSDDGPRAQTGVYWTGTNTPAGTSKPVSPTSECSLP